MRDFKIKKYLKKMDYSYAMGTFPTIELLQKRPHSISKVLLSDNANKDSSLKSIIDLCREKNVRFEFADSLIDKVASKDNTHAIGVFEKYETELTKGSDTVVLVNISDMGNMGTIIRSMLGFGFKDLVLIRPSVDIFDPRVVRASMGGIFGINFKYFDTFEDYISSISKDYTFYPFMLNGKRELNEVSFKQPFGLVFGNEGAGLPESFLDIGESLYIKQSKDIDSLNLSVSVGIALYKASTIN